MIVICFLRSISPNFVHCCFFVFFCVRLVPSRWTISAKNNINLKLVFTSNDFGSFDQSLNFELVGTRRSYQLFCRGKSELPVISWEPRFATLHRTVSLDDRSRSVRCHSFSFCCAIVVYRMVFPHRKKTVKKDEIVQKCYVIDQAEYCFGPLHCGKPREGYRDGRFPENMDTFKISNSGIMQASVHISLKSGQNLPTFIVEPSTMTLEPGESQVRN